MDFPCTLTIRSPFLTERSSSPSVMASDLAATESGITLPTYTEPSETRSARPTPDKIE